MRRALVVLAVLAAVAPVGPARATAPCAPTPRPDPAAPHLQFQRQAFGFHDEELVLCSDDGTHLAARLWVPATCPGVGGCPAVLIAHGFGFNKEVTMGDMLNAARRGMYVLSYDVRGQGASGGQAALLGPEDVADQAALLRWLHAEVAPTKVGAYGLSQGGALSWMAAIYNCGAARAAALDPSIGCDEGGRWIDAIAPLQGPVSLGSFQDGTCLVFAAQAVPYSRGNPAIAAHDLACLADGVPVAEDVARDAARATPFDVAFRELRPRAGSIDVPVYVGTSFNDRLVPPHEILDMYEALDARVDHDEDLRLIVSNDGHGDIGANFAVLDDVFAWLAWALGADGATPPRDAPVAIAQEWDGDAFRLEHGWPIAGSATTDAYLGSGALAAGPGSHGADELRTTPYVDSPPEAPFVPGARVTGAQAVPGARLTYLGEPATATTEVTGEPSVTLWVSTATTAGTGNVQLHVSLSEVTAAGEVREFARARRGLSGVGAEPVAVRLRFNATSFRLEPGSSLLLAITASDAGVAVPSASVGTVVIHRGAGFPSSVSVPTVPVDRALPAGEPPSGASFAEDPFGTICSFFGADCP